MAKRPVPRRLAKKLTQIRADLGLSQTQMVKALNYKASPLYPAMISQFETGRREPPLMLFVGVCAAGGYLYGRADRRQAEHFIVYCRLDRGFSYN